MNSSHSDIVHVREAGKAPVDELARSCWEIGTHVICDVIH
jgi:hypothetical protein